MSAWRALAEDQVFWATVATSATAALIAVVLEARTAREELDRRRIEESEEHERVWAEWQAAFAKYQSNEGADPGRPPAIVRPLPSPKQARDTNRVVTLLLSMWALGVALAGALVATSPAGYPGDWVAALGCVTTLLALTAGVAALLWAASERVRRG